MLFLESSGWQFGYGFLKPGFVDHLDPWKFFYTSNISLKTSFFEKENSMKSFEPMAGKIWSWGIGCGKSTK